MTPGEADSILELLREHGAQLGRIERKVDKTNGRVTKIEAERAVEKALAEKAARAKIDAAAERLRRRSWVPSTATGVACVLLGAAVQHFIA